LEAVGRGRALETREMVKSGERLVLLDEALAKKDGEAELWRVDGKVYTLKKERNH